MDIIRKKVLTTIEDEIYGQWNDNTDDKTYEIRYGMGYKYWDRIPPNSIRDMGSNLKLQCITIFEESNRVLEA